MYKIEHFISAIIFNYHFYLLINYYYYCWCQTKLLLLSLCQSDFGDNRESRCMAASS